MFHTLLMQNITDLINDYESALFVGMTITTVLIIMFTLANDFLYRSIRERMYPGKVPPSDTRLPFLGNLHLFLLNHSRRWHFITSYVARHGKKVANFYLGPSMILTVTTCPQDVEYILKTNMPNFVRGSEFNDIFNDLIGDGVLNADGAAWKFQRKLLVRQFHTKIVKERFSPIMQRHSERMVKVLASNFDAQDVMSRLSVDIIAEIVFGKDLNTMSSSEENVDALKFANAFDSAQKVAEFRFVNPFWRAFTNILPSEREFKTCINIIDSYLSSHIARAKLQEEDKSFLSKLVRMKDDNGKPFCDKLIRDTVVTMFLAGRDGMTQTCAWAIYEAAATNRGDYKAKLQAGDPIFLQAFINESLRLHPPLPVSMRSVTEADVLPSGYQILPGQMIAFGPYFLGRDSTVCDIWKEDAKTFKPERWLDQKTSESYNRLLTFGSGPRTCIGRGMALEAVTIMLSTLFTNYDIKLSDPHAKVTYEPSITLPIKDGLQVTATRLEKNF